MTPVTRDPDGQSPDHADVVLPHRPWPGLGPGRPWTISTRRASRITSGEVIGTGTGSPSASLPCHQSAGRQGSGGDRPRRERSGGRLRAVSWPGWKSPGGRRCSVPGDGDPQPLGRRSRSPDHEAMQRVPHPRPGERRRGTQGAGWVRSTRLGWSLSRCNTESGGNFGQTCHDRHSFLAIDVHGAEIRAQAALIMPCTLDAGKPRGQGQAIELVPSTARRDVSGATCRRSAFPH